ncbi:DnaJ-domain-containing protein [Neolentinus lepideus HHB14362 ss-1]|uniref:DnaJ-domain-containing protein n=1 Tax=Neolentinus lepideus HHB14362 ss-1 TaxID=1314782 RepID=A0A165QIF5_9AGAM|nr:DnaJ-domain-containing protein [Neolentinus lepideus HHB14362 ss-1]
MSSAAYAIGRFVAWSYVPDYATSQCLRVYHHLYRSIFRRPTPERGSEQYRNHYRITFATVVLLFLSYNLVEAVRSLPPNLYEVLGVHPDADDKALKGAFRAFARRNHPDRVGPGGETLFIQVRDAFDALKDPVRRFAYDRFGPDALTWSHCTTVREYLRHGLMQASGFHIVSSVVLLFLSAIGKPSPVAFWRYLLLLWLSTSELSCLLGPSPSPPSDTHFLVLEDPRSSYSSSILNLVFPRRLPYQHVLFLHQLFVFLSVAMSKVAPVLFPQSHEGVGFQDERVWSAVIERMRNTSRTLDREVVGLIDKEFRTLQNLRPSTTPVTSDSPGISDRQVEGVIELLTREMENMIIESRLRKEVEAGPLRTLWETALRRRQSQVQSLPESQPHTSLSPAPVSPQIHSRSPTPVQVHSQSPAHIPTQPQSPPPTLTQPHVFPNEVGASESLLSPPDSVSPVDKKVKLEPPEEGQTELGVGRLPSPRPSPEPPLFPRLSPIRQPSRQASYVRGRSVSY